MTPFQAKMKISFPQEKKFKDDVYGLKERSTCRYTIIYYVTIMVNEVDLIGLACRSNVKMKQYTSSLRKIEGYCPVLPKEKSQVNAMS
jgi:hypothetical protein